MGDPAVYIPLTQQLGTDSWPFSNFVPAKLSDILVTPPEVDPETGDKLTAFTIDGAQEASIILPGLDFLQIVLTGTGDALAILRFGTEPSPHIGVEAAIVLRVDATVLRPLISGTNEPDTSKSSLDIAFGEAVLRMTSEGHLDVALRAQQPSQPAVVQCMIGSTGIILRIGVIEWLTPSTPVATRPVNTPVGFTGLYLRDAEIDIPQAPSAVGKLKLDYAFLGTGGFTAKIELPGLRLEWDDQQKDFTSASDLHGELFGFKGGLTKVGLEFYRSALVGCDIEGDVFIPWVDKRIGLSLTLDGTGGLTATAGLPNSAPAVPQTEVGPGKPGYLLHLAIAEFLSVDLNSLTFENPAEGAAALVLSGDISLVIAGLATPKIEVKALRIDSKGHVKIDGGWLNLPNAKAVSFHGFSFEISKLGFGTIPDVSDPDLVTRRWIGLNGGLKLAEGLPLGASVEGLRISWDASAPTPEALIQSLGISLDGVGLEVTIPGAIKFDGKVAFFHSDVEAGFRGHGNLEIIPLQLGIDCDLIVGRTAGGLTFFYFHLGIDLPVGIPLFATGAAFYGFEGLIAQSMAPDVQPGVDWYYGWYLRDPKGATDSSKWVVSQGVFALGLGATIGTLPDNGFSVSAKALLIVTIPGPNIILSGKGSFLTKRPTSQDPTVQGAWEALIRLGIGDKIFNANLAAQLDVDGLIRLQGGVDVGFSWSSQPPPHLWHVWLGEREMDRRWRASLLGGIFDASAYFQVEEDGIHFGATMAMQEDLHFGPVHVWFEAGIDGAADISIHPQQLHGQLALYGDCGVTAFGVGLGASLQADVAVDAPTPLRLAFDLSFSITVDLWLFSLDWGTTVHFEWSNAGDPVPVTPVIERIAWEHMKVDETGDLPLRIGANPSSWPPSDGQIPLIPPDARPEILFARPIRDRLELAAPTQTNQAPDSIGTRSFSYQIAQVMLWRRDTRKLVAAAGILDAQGGTATLIGVSSLPDVNGAQLQLIHSNWSGNVQRVGGAQLQAAGLPDSTAAVYRLRAYVADASVTVTNVTSVTVDTLHIDLSSGPDLSGGTYTGGTLTAAGTAWDVVGTDSAGVIVVAKAPGQKPATGTALLTAPPPPELTGVWLPDKKTGQSGTRLLLWARTPFAFFRRNDAEVIDGYQDHNADFACGPAPEELPICMDFLDLPIGLLSPQLRTGGLLATSDGWAAVSTYTAPGSNASKHVINLGTPVGDHQGSFTLSFDPPVNRVWVNATQREVGTATVRNGGMNGQVVGTERIPPPSRNFFDPAPTLSFSGQIDYLEIAGSLVSIWSICYTPGWTCIQFDDRIFPQNTTGRQSYMGLDFEALGKMTVTNGVLIVPLVPLVASPMTLAISRMWKSLRKRISRPKPVFDGNIPEIAHFKPATDVLLSHHIRDNLAGQELQRRLAFTTLSRSVPSLDNKLTARNEMLDLPRMPVAGIVNPLVATIPGLGDTLILPQGANIVLERIDPGTIEFNPPNWVAASLTIYPPQPVTRMRVHFEGNGSAFAYGGGELNAHQTVAAGDAATLIAATGFIDRVVLTAPNAVKISRVCYDAGPFGWERYEQWQWRQSIRHSVESFYQNDPVLPPGAYQLDVVAGVVDETSGAPNQPNWIVHNAVFNVGHPPFTAMKAAPDSNFNQTAESSQIPVRYRGGGPLDELATYVDATLPQAGWRPFYRAYDVGVSFNANYVSRLYLEAGTPLLMVVVNAKNEVLRTRTTDVWGTGQDLSLAEEEDQWIQTLRGTGAEACAPFTPPEAKRNVSALCGGALLGTTELHAGELRRQGDPTALYRYEFITSLYAGFQHHLAAHDGRLKTAGPNLRPNAAHPENASQLAGQVSDALQQILSDAASLATARERALQTDPTSDNYLSYSQMYHRVRDQLPTHIESLRSTAETAFDSIWDTYFNAAPGSLPAALEMRAVPGGILVESPEPLHWERLNGEPGSPAPPRIEVTRNSDVPLRAVALGIDAKTFGAPDIGDFAYGGLSWRTSAELQVTTSSAGIVGVTSRVPGAFTVALMLAGALWVDVVLEVPAGQSVTLSGAGSRPGTSTTDRISGPFAGTHRVSAATVLTSIAIAGDGFRLISVFYTIPFEPSSARATIRLLSAKLPSGADQSHHVDVIGYSNVDLTGWHIKWTDAFAPAQPEHYYTFAGTPANPQNIHDAEVLQIYGGTAPSGPDAGQDIYYGGRSLSGGTAAPPPASGAVFQLLDRTGAIVDELVCLPDVAYQATGNFDLIPSGDFTRLFLLDQSGAMAHGHWRVTFTFTREMGFGILGLPTLSVGAGTCPPTGNAIAPERAQISFTLA